MHYLQAPEDLYRPTCVSLSCLELPRDSNAPSRRARILLRHSRYTTHTRFISMMLQDKLTRIPCWMASSARRDLHPRGAGGDLSPPPIALTWLIPVGIACVSHEKITRLLMWGYLSDSRKSIFCILSMVPYGRWKRSTIVTSCTPTGSQDEERGGRDPSGNLRYRQGTSGGRGGLRTPPAWPRGYP